LETPWGVLLTHGKAYTAFDDVLGLSVSIAVMMPITQPFSEGENSPQDSNRDLFNSSLPDLRTAQQTSTAITCFI